MQWWKDRQHHFPTLSRFAIDLYAIPAMAAEPERCFSVSKLTMTTQRLAMAPETLEKLQCLKSWLGHDDELAICGLVTKASS